MDTEERLERAEKRLAELEALVARLVTVAKAHPVGRQLIRLLGLG